MFVRYHSKNTDFYWKNKDGGFFSAPNTKSIRSTHQNLYFLTPRCEYLYKISHRAFLIVSSTGYIPWLGWLSSHQWPIVAYIGARLWRSQYCESGCPSLRPTRRRPRSRLPSRTELMSRREVGVDILRNCRVVQTTEAGRRRGAICGSTNVYYVTASIFNEKQGWSLIGCIRQDIWLIPV